MSNLRAFRALLASDIQPDAQIWEYNVPGLPSGERIDASGLGKSLSFVTSGTTQEIILRFESVPANRVTRAEPLNKLLLISFVNFRPRWPGKSSSDTERPATMRESGDYMTRLLQTGVKLNGIQYHFYGHSNSQLKSRSCFMFAGSKENISAKIEAMGDFSKLKSVAKKAKRIGLLFSSAEMALTLSPERCRDIEDVKRDDYTFTDGCGSISPQLARQLVQRRKIRFRNRTYLPSVYQIRYRGYKGVLTLDPSLQGKIQVEFRDSMRKFKDAPDHSLAVVDYSKPYGFGYLNDEVVVLLHTLGISEKTLLAKQQEHLYFLKRASQGDPQTAFQFLSYCDKTDVAEKLLIEGIEAVRGTLGSLVRQEYAKMLNKREEQRCRILIPKSRLLFGVCDPTSKNGKPGRLKEGECFVRITHDGDGMSRTIINTEVIVTRNPCLHPGDLQKFKTVDVPEFADSLKDCIVFSTRGKRPSADLMSGGDLDGDKFFVTWDPDIIPRTMAEPAEYPAGKELVTFGEVTGDARAEYFARYTNASLGKVKNLYMKWARLGNSMSSECQQLNRLFSQCVDGNRIRIPENLQKLTALEDAPDPPSDTPPFILDVLHEASKQFIEQADSLHPDHTDDIEVLELFLARDKVAISEFELLQLALKWCNRNGSNILEFSELLDFSALTDEQQIWFLDNLPPSTTAPSLVRNGLLQSDMIAPHEARRFRLDHSTLHWKPVFKSSSDRMGRFFPALVRALETFHKKLIILTVDERLSLAIYVPKKVEKASEVQVDTMVRVFAFPHSQGPHSPNYKVLPTKVNYRLFFDEHVFQLYEGKRANTWIFLRRPQNDESLYRNEKKKTDKRRMREATVHEGVNFDCKASIALNKFSSDIQKHVGRVQQNGVLGAEIYVISNRDIQSMRVLDEWLNYVDTDEVLPLFEKLDVDYEIPRLASFDWTVCEPRIVSIVRYQNLSDLRNVASVAELQTIFGILQHHDEKKLLRDTFSYMLDLEAGSMCVLDGRVVAKTLLEYLLEAVYLVPTFLRSQTWKNHKNELEADLVRNAPRLFQDLILLSHDMGSFILGPVTLILQELRRMTLEDFCKLVEHSALAIRSPESALDFLFETLEPETSRLLVGRPLATRQLVSCLFGIALDHIEEASNIRKPSSEELKLHSQSTEKDGSTTVKSTLRIDSSMGGSFRVGDHVRLTESTHPKNALLAKPVFMDTVIQSVEAGEVTFNCLHRPPVYFEQCAWSVLHCGSFVTSKTMLDAVTGFYTTRESCCKIYALLLGLPSINQITLPNVKLPVSPQPPLNASQNAALSAAMQNSLTFIWGPPGTGKTQTIVMIMTQLLKTLPHSRFLITAPTNNACDNLMKRFLKESKAKSEVTPIRVSTQLSKVDPELRSWTCDAMLGTDLSGNHPALRKAKKRVKEARLIFATCIGSGIGLLRDQAFDVVIIDEASQLTEPATLVPLVKGCSRAILVGDHVQLRATVQQNSVLAGYDVSLFERHYGLAPQEGVAKVMLDTQYRMHRSICDFSSSEFYEGRLKTAVQDCERPLYASLFPWPKDNRMVWIDCAAPEDLGRQSKSNAGQAALCKQVVQLLTERPANSENKPGKPLSIVVLTPYTRQKTILTSMMSTIEVSSIDGFQGREADIIIFVTVRCNAYGDLGFLTDMRRLNVVMTRAKAGVVIIGNKMTMTGVAAGVEADESRLTWRRLVERCSPVEVPVEVPVSG